MTFYQKLKDRWQAHNTLVCVGLDPLPEQFPATVADAPNAIFAFNRAIIDATHDLVCAYKPQIAHYAALAAEDQLQQTLDYLRSQYPDIPILLDSKRGDIGSTAEQYAREAFERYGADAVTVNPYMGWDTIQPFAQYRDRGVIVLCRTSNPSAGELQNLHLDSGEPLFEHVARIAARDWNANRNLALVVGATAPAELARVRQIVGDMPILVPGLGAQGGDAEAVLQAGLNAQRDGLIINSSRGILYASQGNDFAAAARHETETLRELANRYR
ncbi:orotidine-5'-phosphate decarboxylase [Natronospirillum operosum]|uniref:Orotidine 5'-phosphate decarboxylase n=1 Tax=Natronospirillum operosum TaxID=2759953 RepID=A0A4Z0WBN2_9GAMM|nr:orotidine-5'-phosphate decarboxylase [Natronospirillum operosum]TGG91068.1 orotidine-5'-phosphate decarboxylase [Natronospirillum operosum]